MLDTVGLRNHYDFLEGEDPLVIYDSVGTDHGSLNPDFHPDWVEGVGLRFSGAQQNAAFPTAVQENAVTDVLIFQNTLPGASGLNGARTMNYPVIFYPGNNEGTDFGSLLGLDGRVVRTLNAAGNDLYSPADAVLGNVMCTYTYGASGQIFWNDRECAAYLIADSKDICTPSVHSGDRPFGWPTSPNGLTFYTRLCYTVRKTLSDIATGIYPWVAYQMARRGVTMGDTQGPDWPLINCFGDSITGGFVSTSDYLTEIRFLLSDNVRYVNSGLVGRTASQINTIINNVGAALCAQTTSPKKLALMMLTTNDITVHRFDADLDAAAATIAALVVTCISSARSAGYSHVGLIGPPRAGGFVGGTEWDTLHYKVTELLKASNHGEDFAVRVDDIPQLGYGADTTNTLYFTSDGIHIARGGYQLIAPRCVTPINSIVGIH